MDENVIEAASRVIAAGSDPYHPEFCEPDDWVRHPETDAKIRRWEMFIPVAKAVVEMLMREIRPPGTVPMPRNVEEAQAMLLLSERYLSTDLGER